MKHKLLNLWLVLILFVGIGAVSPISNVSLLWDASPDASVTGYALYYASTNSPAATNRMDVGMALSCTVSNLVEDDTYWFFVVAYNSVGTESLPSNTLYYTPSHPPLPLAKVQGYSVSQP